jgi:hypothetical protein
MLLKGVQGMSNIVEHLGLIPITVVLRRNEVIVILLKFATTATSQDIFAGTVVVSNVMKIKIFSTGQAHASKYQV